MPCYDPRVNMDSFFKVKKDLEKEEIGTREEHLLCEACFKLHAEDKLEGELLEWFKKHREEDRQFRIRTLIERLPKCWDYDRDFKRLRDKKDKRFEEYCEIMDRIEKLHEASVEMLMKKRM